jgi:acetyl-CoA carboxylase biotin carboxyl carrier protein
MKVKTEIAANVWKIVVKVGDTVTSGQELMILESMKMEIPVEAPCDGVVKAILINEGDAVDDGQEVVELE